MIDTASMPAATPSSTDPVEAIELAAAVLVRNFELLRRRSDVYAELEKAEYLVLRTLDSLGAVDICTLAGALGLDPSTVGRQVSAMQTKGLVERTPDEADRRRSIVSASGMGRELMNTTRVRRRENMSRMLEGWSERDLRVLGKMFTRYNEAVAEMYLKGDA